MQQQNIMQLMQLLQMFSSSPQSQMGPYNAGQNPYKPNPGLWGQGSGMGQGLGPSIGGTMGLGRGTDTSPYQKYQQFAPDDPRRFWQ
jgi:hypothetical protein